MKWLVAEPGYGPRHPIHSYIRTLLVKDMARFLQREQRMYNSNGHIYTFTLKGLLQGMVAP